MPSDARARALDRNVTIAACAVIGMHQTHGQCPWHRELADAIGALSRLRQAVRRHLVDPGLIDGAGI